MSSTDTIIGIDLGGTKSALRRYGRGDWTEEAAAQFPTNASAGFSAVMNEIIGHVQSLRTDTTQAVGIGIPGLVRQPEGRAVTVPNIPGGEGFDVKGYLSEKLGLPVFVDNDARCFTLAEALMGAGKGGNVVVGITFGTGVGGGIVIDGKIFHGADGFAGEIGHMLLMPGRPPFTTDDKRGDIEQFLSGSAMGKRCSEAKRPEDYLDGEVCSFLRPDVFREVAWMVTSLTHLLNPSVVVFGGSTGHALKPHLKEINDELVRWLLPHTPVPRITVAERKDAGTLGAALLTV